MKKLIILPLFSLLFLSCSEDSTGGVSRVTFYPNLSLNGERVVVLTEGDAYTDPGAVADANGEALDVTTTGSVNPNTVGVYKTVYEAFNEDGFSASVTRTVIVLSAAPSAINLEGTFYRNGNAANVTRLGDRIYRTDNATGYTAGNENNLNMVFYNLDDERLYAPFQENVSETGINAESNIGTIIDEDHWNWVIYASGFFGTAVRNFSR